MLNSPGTDADSVGCDRGEANGKVGGGDLISGATGGGVGILIGGIFKFEYGFGVWAFWEVINAAKKAPAATISPIKMTMMT